MSWQDFQCQVIAGLTELKKTCFCIIIIIC